MKLQEVVEELLNRAKQELNQEKKEREYNEDTLLTMLEGTCEKIQGLTE